MQPQNPDVLIIGGGVIGLTTAYFLAREGVSVEIVDKGDFGREASWAGAGILGPRARDDASDPALRLHALGVGMFEGLSADLRAATGVDNGYLRCGGVEFIEHGDADSVRAWRQAGFTFETLDDAGLRRIEPAVVSPGGSGHFFPDMAQVRNPRHIEALLSACRLLGVRLTPGTPVVGFEQAGGRVHAARTPEGTRPAGRYVLTTGAWTDALAAAFGWAPGIRPVRGQIALLRTQGPVLRRIVLCGKRYLVPRSDGRVLVGSTEEHAGFDKRTSAEAIGALLHFAIALAPELARAELERAWAGLRPGSPDELPFIGGVPGMENVFVAAGHFRSGIQLSPATGLLLKEMLLGQTPSLSLEAFRPGRPVPRTAQTSVTGSQA